MDRSRVVEEIRTLLNQGAPWAATDVYRAATATDADDPELDYWGALAFARAGATTLARRLLDAVLAGPGSTPSIRRESLSLSGRLWKDRIDRVHGPIPAGPAAAELARADYQAADAIPGDDYPAINAATLGVLLGDHASATALATRIVSTPSAVRTAWTEATRGEALLILGDVDEARRCYERAAALGHDDAGSLASMRRQLRLLGSVVPQARAVRDALPSAAVIGFAGHMIDAPDRASPRFPPALESAVARALAERFTRADGPRAVVYASAACGGDLLFLEAALAAGAEVNVVLPFDREDFVRTSVAPAGAGWVTRFDRVLAAADRIIHATEERYLGDDVLFEYAQRLVDGLVVLRAAQLETDPVMWFAADAADAGGEALIGGTRRSLDRWRRAERKADLIALDRLRADRDIGTSEVGGAVAVPTVPAVDRPQRTLKATLFADVAGFGRVHDTHAPRFHARFLRLVADQIAASAHPPLAANTWGDALYVVFEDAADGAAFALGVIERMRAIDWTETGLAETSGIRIALHSGPVFCGFDPIVGRDNYFGTSVTKTARIEPVTPPGVVYASEAFVATLASQGATGFVFEYVGELALAKSYGKSRIYAVERR